MLLKCSKKWLDGDWYRNSWKCMHGVARHKPSGMKDDM